MLQAESILLCDRLFRSAIGESEPHLSDRPSRPTHQNRPDGVHASLLP